MKASSLAATSIAETERQVHADSNVGKILRSYVLEQRLGAGGMGTVYAARHATLGTRVAIKVLSGTNASPQQVRHLLAEAEAVAWIDHVNIVKVFDAGYDQELGAFLILELLRGTTLETELEAGSLPVPRALIIAAQIIDALATAHARGVLHRDLKPANIFLETHVAGDMVKVLDFGIAKFARDDSFVTEEGKIIGTPRYMSPEQFRAEPLDARSDTYSMGLVLYEMLTGTLPYPEATTPWQLAIATSGPLTPRPCELVPSLSPALEAVILRACAPLREDRFVSLGEFGAALAAAGALAGHEPVPARSRTRGRGVQILAAVGVVVAVGSYRAATTGGAAAPLVIQPEPPTPASIPAARAAEPAATAPRASTAPATESTPTQDAGVIGSSSRRPKEGRRPPTPAASAAPLVDRLHGAGESSTPPPTKGDLLRGE